MDILRYNSDEDAYFGVLPNGQGIRIEGIEFAEQCQEAGYDPADVFNGEADPAVTENLFDLTAWESCIGANQNVEYVDA